MEVIFNLVVIVYFLGWLIGEAATSQPKYKKKELNNEYINK